MGAEITAVVVDDGEPSLTECLDSLRRQSVDLRIIVAAGPETNLDVAEYYADRVLEPTVGIGRARVKGILVAKTPYVLSCDSEAVYSPRYAEYALRNLEAGVACVKAGTILPRELNPLGALEAAFSPLVPYEFSLAFSREAFLEAKVHEWDYGDPRSDIGIPVALTLTPLPEPAMIVYARLPTRGWTYQLERALGWRQAEL